MPQLKVYSFEATEKVYGPEPTLYVVKRGTVALGGQLMMANEFWGADSELPQPHPVTSSGLLVPARHLFLATLLPLKHKVPMRADLGHLVDPS